MTPIWLCITIYISLNIGELKACERTTYAADILFLIDSSGSVGKKNFDKQLDFIKYLARTVPIGPNYIQIGITTFATKTVPRFDLDDFTNVTELVSAIEHVPYEKGKTLTAEALQWVVASGFANSSGDRDNIENILIVTTDGKSNNKKATLEAARKLRDTNMTSICIGIGSKIQNDEIKSIASTPENAVFVSDFDEMVTTVLNLTLKKVEEYACPDRQILTTDLAGSRPLSAETLTFTSTLISTDFHPGESRRPLLIRGGNLEAFEIIILSTISVIMIGSSICCCRHLMLACKNKDDDDDEDDCKEYVLNRGSSPDVFQIRIASNALSCDDQVFSLPNPFTEINDTEW